MAAVDPDDVQPVAGLDQAVGNGAGSDAPQRRLELRHCLAALHLPQRATVLCRRAVGTLGCHRLESLGMLLQQRQRLLRHQPQRIQRRALVHGKQDMVGIHPSAHPETLRILLVMTPATGLVHHRHRDLRGQQVIGRFLGIRHRMPLLGRLVQHHPLQRQRNAGTAQRLRGVLVERQLGCHLIIGDLHTIDLDRHANLLKMIGPRKSSFRGPMSGPPDDIGRPGS